MRYIEIILKVAFALGGLYLVTTQAVDSPCFIVFLAVSLLLGIVLLFNKQASYNFKQTKKDLMIRRIEGIFLVVYSLVLIYASLALSTTYLAF